ncbi:MAG: S1/P1 nuclease [Pyrinomonadaceae bacterium]|nr:S1/P1 nuclease [Pyrinomonadaceae bacterium]
MRLRNLLLALVIITCCFATTYAWNDTGHKVSARIAWDNMTPQARQKVIEILFAAPEDSQIRTLFATDPRPVEIRQRDFFSTLGTWADLVRDEKNFPVRYGKYNHSTWHYSDVYFKQVDGKPVVVPELKPDAENAIERLYVLEKVMLDKSQKMPERAVALAWILHIASDIHNPVHDAARVTELEPQGDKGANSFDLTPKDSKNRSNLHSFWDSILTNSYPRTSDCDGDYITTIANKLTTDYPRTKLEKEILPSQFDKWSQQGYVIASTEVYLSTLKRNETPSAAYKQKTLDISSRQIALAGYRMAAIFNQLAQ